MDDPDFIVKVTVLDRTGKPVLEWETGVVEPEADEYVCERIDHQGHSLPVAVALTSIHTYDLLGQKPSLDRT